jgi:hypothetical protein
MDGAAGALDVLANLFGIVFGTLFLLVGGVLAFVFFSALPAGPFLARA